MNPARAGRARGASGSGVPPSAAGDDARRVDACRVADCRVAGCRVAGCRVDSPFGALSLWATPTALSHVVFDASATDAKPDSPVLRRAKIALARYFAGDASPFDLPLSLDGTTAFQRVVLTVLRDRVGPGRTVTYGELADLAGLPGRARAVGSALHRNPLPILIPCHRVVAAGGPGGFALGLEVKRRLLALEGCTI